MLWMVRELVNLATGQLVNSPSQPERDAAGYRVVPGQGPRVRSDVVEVMVFRADDPGTGAPELLQIQRAKEPLKGTWQPVMGHIEAGETAVAAALRELHEEVGLSAASAACLGVWALEQVHPYYIAAIDCVMLPPRFAVRAAPGWMPRLNAEHTAHRWVAADEAGRWFMWPGQAAAARELIEHLLAPGSACREALRIETRG